MAANHSVVSSSVSLLKLDAVGSSSLTVMVTVAAAADSASEESVTMKVKLAVPS